MHSPSEASSNPRRQMSFVERVRLSDGSGIHLIKTYDANDVPCWFLLKASQRSLLRLKRTQSDEFIDLNEYGHVMSSGWGHEPGEGELSPSE